jgi:protoporphyrinogen oxidase
LETIDTLIIGAGPAGLTTAYNLAKAGHDVLVIEQDKHYVGGISRTVSYKGFLFDIGGHRFFSKCARWWHSGTRSFPTIFSCALGCRAFITRESSTPIR